MTVMMPIPFNPFPACKSFVQLDVRRATIDVGASGTGHRVQNLLSLGEESRKMSTVSYEHSEFTPQGEENGILFTVGGPAATQLTKQRSTNLNNNRVHPEISSDATDDASQKQHSKRRRSRRKPKCAIV